MAVKGYVVRGTHRRGWPVFAYDHSGAFGGPSETDIPLHVFPSLDTASGARAHMVRCGCSDVAIFRVLDDGREERLPSYEEALALLDGDPLAALEAAERRLLEAGGWREDSPGWWNDGLAGVSTISTERRTVALTIERRRLAAKGGA